MRHPFWPPVCPSYSFLCPDPFLLPSSRLLPNSRPYIGTFARAAKMIFHEAQMTSQPTTHSLLHVPKLILIFWSFSPEMQELNSILMNRTKNRHPHVFQPAVFVVDYFDQSSADGRVGEEISSFSPLIRSREGISMAFVEADDKAMFRQWLCEIGFGGPTGWEGSGEGDKVEETGVVV
ncbi:hypothetical protein BDZ45DRAFT_754613 [Acephala macrosclerotiorum]|nr:hypothetical protein BDZ45DRAFT_754613 [Acephala macrosclerotiorum]